MGYHLAGVVLPLSLFYDEPSLLDAAKYLHRAAGSGSAGDGEEENLEALLQDDEARRSYHLSQGRSAMNAKDRAIFEVAVDDQGLSSCVGKLGTRG